MDQTNLDIYGHAPIPWSRAEKQLAATDGPELTHFLSTVRPEGRPHVAGIGALWEDGHFYIVSGPGTRKSRNLAARAECVISVRLPDIDLVVEGVAARVPPWYLYQFMPRTAFGVATAERFGATRWRFGV